MTQTSGVTLGSTVDLPLLVDAPSRHEPQESRQFISQSVHSAAAPAQFNTLKQDLVKRLRVCGATLKWDHNDDNYGLMSLQGTDTLDLAALEMHADIVQILSPLRFPGTHVTIYARELIFGDEGAIDTSPLPYSAQAASPSKTKDGIPADAAGKPT